MFKAIKANFFPTIIALTALAVSASAAYYSVSGLSKLFAGAAFAVTIMAGSLEVAKLVIATLLHTHWKGLNILLKWYLTISVVILIGITSMGIYGYLSAAYQETYQKLSVNENKVQFLENKATFYESDLERHTEELEFILQSINSLSQAKAKSIQVRDKNAAGEEYIRTTVSTAELRLAQQRLAIEEENRTHAQLKRQIVADSLQNIKLQILELRNNSDTVGELGPLQYISGVIGKPMDKIINWLLLIIIFVFDPLAVSLVLAANYAFMKANSKTIYGEFEEESPIYVTGEDTIDKLADRVWKAVEEEPAVKKETLQEVDPTKVKLLNEGTEDKKPKATPPKKKRGRPAGTKNEVNVKKKK